MLRDGASAQYGSDAIAGVINVILRKDKGWGFDATYGATKEGDGRDFKVSASAGTKLGPKGSLFVTAYTRDHSPTNRSRARHAPAIFRRRHRRGTLRRDFGQLRIGHRAERPSRHARSARERR